MLLKYLELGKIVSTHGVRGELRVQPWCDSPEFFQSFKTMYIGRKDKAEYNVLGARAHGNIMLLTLDGVDSLEKAELLRNKTVFVLRSDAPLAPGRYFIAELIGCKVVDADDESKVYGAIKDVTNSGASDIWHITAENGREYMLPSIPEVVCNVDVEACIAKVRPMRGIFEEAEEVRED